MRLLSPPCSQVNSTSSTGPSGCWWDRGPPLELLQGLRKGQHSSVLRFGETAVSAGSVLKRPHRRGKTGLNRFAKSAKSVSLPAQAKEGAALLWAAIKEKIKQCKTPFLFPASFASPHRSLIPISWGAVPTPTFPPTGKDESVGSRRPYPQPEEVPEGGTMLSRTQILMNH